MKTTTLNEIKSAVENLYGQLEVGKMYDIDSLDIKIETPEGFSLARSFIVKRGYDSIVTYKNGCSTRCSSLHFLRTPVGSRQVMTLDTGIEVETRDGITTIEDIQISDIESDYYDIEVANKTHLYYTADGICHHNTGKTHSVEEALAAQGLQDGKGYFKNTGSVSAAGLYSLLFKHRDDILLFDDCDDVFGDQEARNILKAATDTKKRRKLVWNKMGKNVVDPDSMTDEEMLDQGLLPRFFDFTGRIIFISNLSINKLDPDGALRTRAYLIDINPTDMEIYDFMDKICDKIPLQDGLTLTTAERKHVVKLLRNGNSKQSANLRKLSRGLSLAAAAKGTIPDEQLQRMIKSYA